jgi:hypothetical protein
MPSDLAKDFDARFDKRADETPAASDILSDIAPEKIRKNRQTEESR